jgi:outer membrane receptor protein involved in Fe transport
MRKSVWLTTLSALLALTIGAVGRLDAQGVTTAAVTGTVTDQNGGPLAGFQVVITHGSTGATAGVLTRADGRYFLPGLQPGGPYTIRVEGLGYASEIREGVTLALSQTARFDFALRTQAVALEGLDVTATRDPAISKTRTGAATVVGEETVDRMPTLNRDFTSFTRLAPQISTSGSGSNAGGRNSKFNNIQLDGASYNNLFGLGSGGAPGDDVGAKPISIEAIQEFQVVISPFDVRQGGFTGAGINAVTKSGTNEFHGSLSVFGRNQNFAGRYIKSDGKTADKLGDYTDQGAAFSLGGPVIKDKLHFFVAGELSSRKNPNGGVAIGRESTITAAEVQPIVDYVKQKYGYDAGALGEVTMERFSDNLFGRLDYTINQNHRLTLRHNYVSAGDDNLSRTNAQYALGNAGYQKTSKTNSTVAQLNSSFGGRFFNEFRLGYSTIRDVRQVGESFPFVKIGVGSGRTIVLGTEQYSPQNVLDQDVLEVTNDLTFNSGRHTFTVGTHNEFFRFANLFVRNPFGFYTFNDFAAFQAGTPSRYEASYLLPGGQKQAEFAVQQYGFYVQDQFDVTDRLTLTAGLRYDISFYPDKPTFNKMVLDSLGRHTDEVPSGNGLFNPRVGFNWDVMGDESTQLRGGIGYFSGRTPYVWISNAYGNTGADYASFTCDGVGGKNPPAFVADPHNQPQGCAGATVIPPGTINTVDKNFKFPQVLRTTLGLDRRLPAGFVGTLEWIYTKSVHDVLFRELTATDEVIGQREGRDVYRRRTAGFATVTDITNTDLNYSYSLTAQLQKRFSNNWDLSTAYTYGQAWDVTSTTSSQAYSNWRYNPVGVSPNAPKLRPSNFDVRHRVIANGTYRLDVLKKAPTELSLIYVGESGRPFSYSYSSDINGDGSPDNDLIYVPASQNEIRFAGTAQQQQDAWNAFNSFIESVDCLRESRGQVLERNACRTGWSNQLDLRLTQTVPSAFGHKMEINLDVINVANLLNKDWGKSQYVSNQNDAILKASGALNVDANGHVLYEAFKPRATPYQLSDLSSRYQIQLGARYRF